GATKPTDWNQVTERERADQIQAHLENGSDYLKTAYSALGMIHQRVRLSSLGMMFWSALRLAGAENDYPGRADCQLGLIQGKGYDSTLTVVLLRVGAWLGPGT
ncbi:hypothetical protein XENOCAPTIV_016920, partial [Xenoophorus captivus]